MVDVTAKLRVWYNHRRHHWIYGVDNYLFAPYYYYCIGVRNYEVGKLESSYSARYLSNSINHYLSYFKCS